MEYEKREQIPINIYIDDNNNGIITYRNAIYKIKNLNLTNDKITLLDEELFNINNSIYYVNNKGNGVLVYSKDSYKNEQVFPDEYDFKYNFYSMEIENNDFKIFSVKKYFLIFFL
ncbi:MAG: hypothetical protein U0457_11535 [Candidatus Sericytochromatia bacterium]